MSKRSSVSETVELICYPIVNLKMGGYIPQKSSLEDSDSYSSDEYEAKTIDISDTAYYAADTTSLETSYLPGYQDYTQYTTLQPMFSMPDTNVPSVLGSYIPTTSYNPEYGAQATSCHDKMYVATSGENSYYIQHEHKMIVPDQILHDGVAALSGYPFNTQSNGDVIKDIRIRLDDLAGLTLSLQQHLLISDKPVLIEIKEGVLFIWSTTFKENNILTSQGSTIVNGYRIEDFNCGSIKVQSRFEFNRWNICQMKISNLTVTGSNNTISINSDLFDKDVDIKIYGKNVVTLNTDHKLKLDKLKVFCTHSFMDWNDVDVNELTVDMEGNGNFKNINVINKGSIKIVGNGTVSVKKNKESTEIKQEKNGQILII